MNESDLRVNAALQVLKSKVDQLMQDLVNAYGELAVLKDKSDNQEATIKELDDKIKNLEQEKQVVSSS